jgi:hypothetical protein
MVHLVETIVTLPYNLQSIFVSPLNLVYIYGFSTPVIIGTRGCRLEESDVATGPYIDQFPAAKDDGNYVQECAWLGRGPFGIGLELASLHSAPSTGTEEG